MYRVTEIYKVPGSCMQNDSEKTFLTKFFAKLYYTFACKRNDYTRIEEKFANSWVLLSSHVRHSY